MLKSTKGILSVCNQIFNPKTCKDLAYKHGFIKRSSSKLRGDEFLKTIILPSNNLSEDSLDGLCLRIKEFNPAADLSPSALSQRINNIYSVNFIKACMQKVLQEARLEFMNENKGVLNDFNNIYIQDSTVFELNQHLHKVYPGTKRGGKKGGSSCKAQMKIDLIHNFATGTIESAEIYEGKRPDQALTDKILKITKAGDLIIRDLGYFKISVFKIISDLGAYFISRFPSHVKVYLNSKDKEQINLGEYLRKKQFRGKSMIDLNVWIGEERLPVRLIAYRVPPDVVKERRRKTHINAKNMGRTTSKAKLELLKYSLFITNIPKNISGEIIGTIYRLRWEIKLIFKQWKSLLRMDVIKGTRRERIDCLIWGRLCMVILLANIVANFMKLAMIFWGRELSPQKLIQYILRNDRLCRAVKTNKIEEFENEILQDLERRLLKNKRCLSTMRERVMASEPYYGVSA